MQVDNGNFTPTARCGPIDRQFRFFRHFVLRYKEAEIFDLSLDYNGFSDFKRSFKPPLIG